MLSEQSSLAQRDNNALAQSARAVPTPPNSPPTPKTTHVQVPPAHLQPLRVHGSAEAEPRASRRALAAVLKGVRGHRAAAEAQTQLALRDPVGEAGRSGAEPPLAAGRRGRALAAGIAGRRRGSAEGGLRVEKGARPDGGEDKEGQTNGPRRTAVGGPGKT